MTVCLTEPRRILRHGTCSSNNHTLSPLQEFRPVVDATSNVTYRNGACAVCNNVTRFTYWNLETSCRPSITNNTKNVIDYLKDHDCEWNYSAPSGIYDICVLKKGYYPAKPGILSVICDLCDSYAMVFSFQNKQHRNPHCVLCNPITDPHVDKGILPVPALKILFRFTLRMELATQAALPDTREKNSANKSDTQPERNATKQAKDTQPERNATKPAKDEAQRFITAVGFGVSIFSLMVLIVIYVLLKELRNLPGKQIINLASAFVFYQTVFLFAAQTSIKAVCMAVAVLLHYFLMVSFMWMAVIAHDLAKTFTSTGKFITDNK